MAEAVREIPLGELGQPQDIANIATFLASARRATPPAPPSTSAAPRSCIEARARRRDAHVSVIEGHRKMGATTTASLIAGEGLGKPPFGSRPLFAGGRQVA